MSESLNDPISKLLTVALGRTKARLEAFVAQQHDNVVYVSAVQVIGCLEILVEELDRADAEAETAAPEG